MKGSFCTWRDSFATIRFPGQISITITKFFAPVNASIANLGTGKGEGLRGNGIQ